MRASALFYVVADTDAPATTKIGGWCLATRSSTTAFVPPSLRSLVARARYVIRRNEASLTGPQLIAEASSSGYVQDIMAVLARQARARGSILWLFDSSSRQFKSLSTWGVRNTRPLSVPSTPTITGADVQRGIVSLVRPERGWVVYDAEDVTAWRPTLRPKTWKPRDEQIFHENNWRSCVAHPILSEGLLVGAVSLYGSQSGNELHSTSRRLPLELLNACLQGYLRARQEEIRIQEIENSFDEELLARSQA